MNDTVATEDREQPAKAMSAKLVTLIGILVVGLVWGTFCQGGSRGISITRALFLEASLRASREERGFEIIESGMLDSEGARWWRVSTLAYLYAAGRRDPNHDAVMRIESEAPRRRLHSSRRRDGHVQQRKAATSDRHGIQTALS